jgi:hypothetical protein
VFQILQELEQPETPGEGKTFFLKPAVVLGPHRVSDLISAYRAAWDSAARVWQVPEEIVQFLDWIWHQPAQPYPTQKGKD